MKRHLIRAALAISLLPGASLGARAFEWSSVAMPETATPPSALSAPQWSGLSTNAGTFGDYKFSFGNRLMLGVSNTPDFGFSRPLGGPSGFGFSGSSVKLGYDMGRVTPWVGVSQSTFGLSRGFSSLDRPADPFSGSAFNQPGMTSVAAGVDLAITNNLSVGFSVSAGTVRNGWGP